MVHNKLSAGGRHNMPRPSPPSLGAEAPRAAEPTALQSADRNAAVGSHGQYVPTLTAAAAWRVNAAVSKAAWWPWSFTLKVMSKSRVTWATPILVFLGLSVIDLGPMYTMYTTDRQTDVRQHHRLMPAYYGRGHNKRLQVGDVAQW